MADCDTATAKVAENAKRVGKVDFIILARNDSSFLSRRGENGGIGICWFT